MAPNRWNNNMDSIAVQSSRGSMSSEMIPWNSSSNSGGGSGNSGGCGSNSKTSTTRTIIAVNGDNRGKKSVPKNIESFSVKHPPSSTLSSSTPQSSTQLSVGKKTINRGGNTHTDHNQSAIYSAITRTGNKVTVSTGSNNNVTPSITTSNCNSNGNNNSHHQYQQQRFSHSNSLHRNVNTVHDQHISPTSYHHQVNCKQSSSSSSSSSTKSFHSPSSRHHHNQHHQPHSHSKSTSVTTSARSQQQQQPQQAAKIDYTSKTNGTSENIGTKNQSTRKNHSHSNGHNHRYRSENNYRSSNVNSRCEKSSSSPYTYYGTNNNSSNTGNNVSKRMSNSTREHWKAWPGVDLISTIDPFDSTDSMISAFACVANVIVDSDTSVHSGDNEDNVDSNVCHSMSSNECDLHHNQINSEMIIMSDDGEDNCDSGIGGNSNDNSIKNVQANSDSDCAATDDQETDDSGKRVANKLESKSILSSSNGNDNIRSFGVKINDVNRIEGKTNQSSYYRQNQEHDHLYETVFPSSENISTIKSSPTILSSRGHEERKKLSIKGDEKNLHRHRTTTNDNNHLVSDCDDPVQLSVGEKINGYNNNMLDNRQIFHSPPHDSSNLSSTIHPHHSGGVGMMRMEKHQQPENGGETTGLSKCSPLSSPLPLSSSIASSKILTTTINTTTTTTSSNNNVVSPTIVMCSPKSSSSNHFLTSNSEAAIKLSSQSKLDDNVCSNILSSSSRPSSLSPSSDKQNCSQLSGKDEEEDEEEEACRVSLQSIEIDRFASLPPIDLTSNQPAQQCSSSNAINSRSSSNQYHDKNQNYSPNKHDNFSPPPSPQLLYRRLHYHSSQQFHHHQHPHHHSHHPHTSPHPSQLSSSSRPNYLKPDQIYPQMGISSSTLTISRATVRSTQEYATINKGIPRDPSVRHSMATLRFTEDTKPFDGRYGTADVDNNNYMSPSSADLSGGCDGSDGGGKNKAKDKLSSSHKSSSLIIRKFFSLTNAISRTFSMEKIDRLRSSRSQLNGNNIISGSSSSGGGGGSRKKFSNGLKPSVSTPALATNRPIGADGHYDGTHNPMGDSESVADIRETTQSLTNGKEGGHRQSFVRAWRNRMSLRKSSKRKVRVKVDLTRVNQNIDQRTGSFKNGDKLMPKDGEDVWGRVVSINSDLTRTVEVYRNPGRPFGFFVARGTVNNIKGIFISRVEPSRERMIRGLLDIGDRITAIDGVDITDATVMMANQLMAHKTKLILKIVPFIAHRSK
ncbi:uncharacterized protein LOC141850665 [Brevipalpus obovatus]|uniref:uncharacterized protein LOC141850665 n=1 Tax=Brevipalpus obovatus TaxID=246614 RepID=UPI003D9E9843